MSGAWEMPGPNVLVATLTRELVATKWAISYRNMQLPPNSATSVLSGMPFDHARNQAVENMLNHGFMWLYYLDDDVCVPPDTIARLMHHGKDIVSGLYYRRAAPVAPVMLNFDAQGAAQWITQWPANALIEADLVGAGCLLVHRRVFERMPRPWFEWQLGKETPIIPTDGGPRLSEDFAFCRAAKQRHGFKIYVDTSIACEHVGLGESVVGGNFRPSNV